MPKSPKKDKVYSTIVWGDNHSPYMCIPSHQAVYQFAKDKQPKNHVHIGDCLDLSGISRHVKDDLKTQVDDLVQDGLTQLGEHFNHLMKINPKSNIYWIKGNHDIRLEAFVRKNPSWAGILDSPLRLLKAFGDCDTSKIKYIELDDHEDEFTIGKLHFTHGHYTCKHTASKHVDAYAESVCFGHAHTIQSFYQTRRKHAIAGYCVGHMMNKMGRRYLKGAPTRWVKGFGYLETIERTGQFQLSLIPIIEGKFIFDGKVYGK